MTELKVKPFSNYEKEAEQIPSIINKYINAPEKTEGSKFEIKKDGKSEDTGHGMSYYDRLRIFLSNNSEPIYSTGFQLWRPGQAFSTNRPKNSINGVKLLEERENSAVFGYRNGVGEIFVKECDIKGHVSLIKKFNMTEHEKAVKSRVTPKDSEEFKSWVGRNLQNVGGSTWHRDIYHDGDDICVVVARHCSRSVDATHDYFQVFVWKKGQGVAISEMYKTNGRASYTKFSTNYLRCNVSIEDNGEVVLEGKSQFGDVKVNKTFNIT